MKRFGLFILVLNMILMIGCVSPITQGPASSGNSQATGEVIELPQRVIIDRKDVPGDVELVLAAMVNVIRGGEENIPNVNFDREGTHEFLEEQFTYKGFDVEFAEIIYFKTERALDHVRYALLESGLYFADAIGRSAYVRVLAEYAVSKSDIFITNTEYEILPNPYPKVNAFIVPRAVLESASPEVKHNFTSLYLLARQHAVTMKPTQEERIRHEQYKQLSFMGRLQYKSGAIPESYCVMVFCMERLRPESRFIMSVSKNEKVSNRTLSAPYYMTDNGWVVGIVGGKFALDDYGKDIFFHVQFNPGIDPANTELKHISRFSSIKNYHPDRIKEPVNPYLEAWKKQGIKVVPVAQDGSTWKKQGIKVVPVAQDGSTWKKQGIKVAPVAQDGSISSGTVFLNPAAVEDAKIIQKRLADLGFYIMKIDGAFGKGSRRSLEAFKKANGLGADSEWNLTTQKALFKGSGL